jgi:predicted DsbA family dithiol-disulfide isomerase
MQDRLTIPLHYDFASTICFVTHRVMEQMRGELDSMGVTLDWRPLDLVAITGWRRGEPVEGPRRENALRVARELGVAVRMPGFWLDSRPAHCVALGLAGGPKQATWRERVWTAAFEEGRDIGLPEELERLGDELAIDVRELVVSELSHLEAVTEAAREDDVTGVPTFHIGFPLGGIQDPDTMRLLFQRWVTKRRQERG